MDADALPQIRALNDSWAALRQIAEAILNEIKEFKKGNVELTTRQLSEPSSPQEIRLKLNLSQSAFAALMGVSVRTLQDWEQGRREPQGPALALLRIAEQHPEVFSELD
ncbi:helix-turn-helix domain-containing protein [Vreelandella utahensis]|uniref:helix-turn-helix domain-containing protein n=1 Tax=Vreelandella halophila TaxID=86177 RepID=UPI000985E300|nr:helix-turn-helix domain-containing protein [Halomonas utahensis]